jgi:hypothetical protein
MRYLDPHSPLELAPKSYPVRPRTSGLIAVPGDIVLERVKVPHWHDFMRQDREADWRIHDPLEKLRAKYSRGGSLVFDFYVFHFPHTEADRVTSVDLTAVDRLMAGNASPRSTQRNTLRVACADALPSALTAIPPEADIEDDCWDHRAQVAADALMQHGVKLAIASKILMVKRPWLFPTLDAHLQHALGSEEDVMYLLRQMRRLLHDNREAIDQLQKAVESEYGLRISPVRVLEQLLWFDWNLEDRNPNGICRVNGFPDWGLDTRHIEKGVVRMRA